MVKVLAIPDPHGFDHWKTVIDRVGEFDKIIFLVDGFNQCAGHTEIKSELEPKGIVQFGNKYLFIDTKHHNEFAVIEASDAQGIGGGAKRAPAQRRDRSDSAAPESRGQNAL